jgi:hypothetical protein
LCLGSRKSLAGFVGLGRRGFRRTLFRDRWLELTGLLILRGKYLEILAEKDCLVRAGIHRWKPSSITSLTVMKSGNSDSSLRRPNALTPFPVGVLIPNIVSDKETCREIDEDIVVMVHRISHRHHLFDIDLVIEHFLCRPAK